MMTEILNILQKVNNGRKSEPKNVYIIPLAGTRRGQSRTKMYLILSLVILEPPKEHKKRTI